MAEIDTSANFYGAERVVDAGTSASYSSTSKGELDVSDFMTLFCTELTNQDIFSGSSSGSSGGNSSYISQLAQFTTMQTMKTLTEIIYAQYGSSMVGKTVSVASYDSLGNYTQDEGVVESVSLLNGDCTLTVNGQQYKMSAVMEVKDSNASSADTSKKDDAANTEETQEV